MPSLLSLYPTFSWAVRRFTVLRLRALANLQFALERRRIAHPRLRTTPIFKEVLQQGFATGEMGVDQIALQIPDLRMSGRGHCADGAPWQELSDRRHWSRADGP
jgi:hypothetical protein